MSILIKGIKFDGHCWSCPCLDGEYGDCNALEKEANHTGEPLPDCPIIKLPDEHGDLVDRDKLKHGFCVECTLYPDNCLGENCDWGSIYHIEHAPAVIPAERSEE